MIYVINYEDYDFFAFFAKILCELCGKKNKKSVKIRNICVIRVQTQITKSTFFFTILHSHAAVNA